MKIPKAKAAVSPSRFHQKNPELSGIIAKSPRGGQGERYKKLIQAIEQQDIESCLEAIEESGYVGDTKLFILAYAQVFGGAS